jgi:hypothetical protein
MDARFESTPSDEEIVAALALWPELAGKRMRPLLVTAFGEIFVELDTGDVYAADPIELTCERIAQSTQALQTLFSDPKWAQETLITSLALLASERGLKRAPHQVFAVAPHPSLTGKMRVENLMPMDLKVWHHIAAQLRLESPS